jgi:NitT/TauT family transport system permease protein
VFTETVKLAQTGQLERHLSFTFTNFVVGFLISVVVGIPLGLMLGASKTLDQVLGPYLWALYSTPRLALLPLITVAMGFGWESKVLLIFLAAVFMIIMNTWAGVKTVDTSLVRAAKVFGANRIQIFAQVVVPFTLPFIAEGLRLGITRAIVTTLVAEMIASSQGMGYLVMRAMDSFNTAQMYAMILLLVTFSVSVVSLMRRLESWLAPWRDAPNV